MLMMIIVIIGRTLSIYYFDCTLIHTFVKFTLYLIICFIMWLNCLNSHILTESSFWLYIDSFCEVCPLSDYLLAALVSLWVWILCTDVLSLYHLQNWVSILTLVLYKATTQTILACDQMVFIHSEQMNNHKRSLVDDIMLVQSFTV